MSQKSSMVITGGAGFIGSNAAVYFIQKGYDVTVIDNISRPGAEKNLAWLQKEYPSVKIVRADIRDAAAMNAAIPGHDVVLHLAAQVAVTTSVSDPRSDFEINALGTFNVLEAARSSKKIPIFLFSSTNKVYGGMEEIVIEEKDGAYCYRDFPQGISESELLDFHSPYGCSKGAADQYVRDYHRIYGIRSVVLRQSCIYGPRQFGMEDQGWVAWFIIAHMLGKRLTVYGDGKQVRDVLYIDDLLAAYDAAIRHIDTASGKIYNIGGGATNTLAVWSTFGPILERLFGEKIPMTFSDWRPGDQKVYISNIEKAKKELGWKPHIGVEQGIEKLYHWVQENATLFR